MSGAPYLVVAGCEAGDTILCDEMGCIGTAGDNGEPAAEGLYLSISIYSYKRKLTNHNLKRNAIKIIRIESYI